MSSSEKTTYEDSVLIKYLIGALPESAAARLDELSVSDNDFSIRLEAIENDLVDSWARGELSGETLEQFNRTYLSSPERLSKLRFAQALVVRQGRNELKDRSLESSTLAKSTFQPSWARSAESRKSLFSGWFPKWAPATVALLALLTSAYLATVNSRLRRELAQETVQRQTLEAKQQEIAQELAARNLEAKNQGQITASQRHSTDQSTLISVLLLPALRGANGVQAVSIPNNADRVMMRLQLEADDFSAYRAALRDSGLGQIVWHSEDLRARTDKGRHVVLLSVPAGLLKEHNYLFELTGVRASGEEILATYPFRVALR